MLVFGDGWSCRDDSDRRDALDDPLWDTEFLRWRTGVAGILMEVVRSGGVGGRSVCIEVIMTSCSSFVMSLNLRSTVTVSTVHELSAFSSSGVLVTVFPSDSVACCVQASILFSSVVGVLHVLSL